MQELKEVTNRWLARNAKGQGVLACGILYSDQTTSNHSASEQFPSPALDGAWNCLANAFQYLKQNESQTEQMRWVFQDFLLHGAIRGDNACLGILTSKTEAEFDPALVNRMVAEFNAIFAEKR